MKKYIFSLAALLFTAVAFTACNDENGDDFDDVNVSYDSTMPYGIWETGYVDGNLTYSAVYTKDEAGEDMLYVQRTDTLGNVTMLFMSDTASYDAETGMLTAEAAVSYYGDGVHADSAATSAYLAKMLDGTTILQIISGGRTRVNAKLSPKNLAFQPNVVGYWESVINVDEDTPFVVFELYADNTAYAYYNDFEAIASVWTYENGVLTISNTTNKSVITATFNEDRQFIATLGEDSMQVYPGISDSEVPVYDFTKKLTGTFTYVQVFSGSDDVVVTPVDLDDPEASTFTFSPFVNVDAVEFTWDMVNNSIAVKPQPTGYTDEKYGPMYIATVPEVYDVDPTKYPSYYEASEATFYFNFVYFVEAGYFGMGAEPLVLNGYAEESVRALNFARKTVDLRVRGQKDKYVRKHKQMRPNLKLKMFK